MSRMIISIQFPRRDPMKVLNRYHAKVTSLPAIAHPVNSENGKKL
jgi:hypothetical protein